MTGHVAYVELTGECHVGVQGDICPHGDVNTSDDGAAKFNHAVHKYTERSAKFNIDGKFAFGAWGYLEIRFYIFNFVCFAAGSYMYDQIWNWRAVI